MPTISCWIVSVIVRRTKRHTLLQEWVSIEHSSTVLDTGSVLSKVPKRTHFDAEESSRVSVQAFRTVNEARSIECIFAIFRTVKHTDSIDDLGIVVRGTFSHAQHIKCVPEMARSRAKFEALSGWLMSIIKYRRHWTE